MTMTTQTSKELRKMYPRNLLWKSRRKSSRSSQRPVKETNYSRRRRKCSGLSPNPKIPQSIRLVIGTLKAPLIIPRKRRRRRVSKKQLKSLSRTSQKQAKCLYSRKRRWRRNRSSRAQRWKTPNEKSLNFLLIRGVERETSIPKELKGRLLLKKSMWERLHKRYKRQEIIPLLRKNSDKNPIMKK